MTQEASPISLAHYLFERMQQLDIHALFGVPGDFSLGLLDELEEYHGVRWVGTASELGAAYAADGYARARGFGALCTTFGVGELSAANGVAGSMAEDVAVLHVVAAPTTSAMASGALVHHTLADGDHHRFGRIAAEITASQHVVRPDSACADVDAALLALLTSRRPTYLLLPQDLASRVVDRASLLLPLVPAQPDSATVDAAAALIRRFVTRHPDAVLLAGHLLERHGLRARIGGLLSAGRSIAVLPNAKSIVDEDSAGYVGVFNGKLCAAPIRDVIERGSARIVVGCTLADTTTGGFSHDFAAATTLVIERDQVSWDDEKVAIEFRTAAPILLDVLEARAPNLPAKRPVAATLAALEDGDGELDQDTLWATLAATLEPGTRLFAETGTSYYGALDIDFPPNTVFEPSPIWSSIGHALPAAIGAALGDRKRRAVVVIGDGAAQMVAQELGVIGRERLDPIIVLVDNGGYTVERVIRGAHARYNDVVAWNWPALPAALGIEENSMSVSAPEGQAGFRADLRRAITERGRAHLIVVRTSLLDTTPTLSTMSRMLRAKVAAEAVASPTSQAPRRKDT